LEVESESDKVEYPRRSERLASQFRVLLSKVRSVGIRACNTGYSLLEDSSVFFVFSFLASPENPEPRPAEELSSLDAYRFTADDVDPERRVAARWKAIADYDESGSWDIESTCEQNSLPHDAIKIPGRHVESPKIIDGVLDLKSRWTPKGFKESDPGSTESPTATHIALRVAEALRLRFHWDRFKFDVSYAFFQADVMSKPNVWLELPPELQEPGRGKLYRRLLREVPGMKSGSRSWFDTFRRFLLEIGMVQSRVDRCTFLKYGEDGKLALFINVHVDDGIGGGKTQEIAWFKNALFTRFALKDSGFSTLSVGDSAEFCGIESTEDAGGVTQTQEKYVHLKLREISLSKIRTQEAWDIVTEKERADFRSCLGAIRWAHRTAPEVGYELAKLSSLSSREDCSVHDLLRANQLVRILKEGLTRQTPHQPHFKEKPRVRIPRLSADFDVKVVCVGDAGEPKDERGYNGKWHGGIVIGLMEDNWHMQGRFAPIFIKSGHITRVAHSSFDGETLVGIEGVDVSLSVAFLVEEFLHGVRPSLWDRKLAQLEGTELSSELMVPIEQHTDAKDLVDRVRKITFDPKMSKRRKTDIFDYQELEEMGIMRPLIKIAGPENPVDCLTKAMPFASKGFTRLLELVRDGVYEIRV
jgi:hypothetical protein